MNGVVIGKFYPPHRGHKFLIDNAAGQVDQLTVIVCAHPSQTISGEQRAEWLKEIHPGVKIEVTPDDLPDEPEPWARRTIELLGRRPDVVFTSELYGDGYAHAMGCRHICVDRNRSTVPISATDVRRDPCGNWRYLEACVRAHFARRVVLIGVESTGKTTLAAELAAKLHTACVEEYGREYSLHKRNAWQTEDFLAIATEQQRRENEAARLANKVLICDTNATVTGVWHERYMGFRSPEVEAIGNRDKVDLYLLAIPDFPFVQDGTRDGEHIRVWMHQRFVDRLEEVGPPVVTLAGSHERRLQTALEATRG
ncbi:MAG TPA: AAA family ATPase [Fimbriimonas sp.]|nr:AAA family ATPase [Fimbriimonas sp.]